VEPAPVLLAIVVMLAACQSRAIQHPCGVVEDPWAQSIELPHRADPPDGRPVILLLGDSFAYGFGVHRNETVAALLQNRLNAEGHDYQVVNLGVYGYNTPLVFQRLEYMLPKYPTTRIVSYEYFNNDFYPTTSFLSDSSYRTPGKTIYHLLRGRKGGEKPLLRWFRERYLQEPYRLWMEDENRARALRQCNVKDYLVRMSSHLRERGIPLVVFLPPFHADDEVEGFLREDTMKPLITLLPVRETLEATIPKEEYHGEYRLSDGHPNAEGQRHIADELFRQLSEGELLP